RGARGEASVEMMRLPGATRSGLAIPSTVVPYDEKAATASSAILAVPLSSVAPTVIRNGSLAGEVMPAFGPALPAATTTTMPWSHASSAAASNISVTYESTTGVDI